MSFAVVVRGTAAHVFGASSDRFSGNGDGMAILSSPTGPLGLGEPFGPWAEIVAATPDKLSALVVYLLWPTAVAGILAEVGVGPAGSEVPIMMFRTFGSPGGGDHVTRPQYWPISVPRNARLSVRMKTTVTSGNPVTARFIFMPVSASAATPVGAAQFDAYNFSTTTGTGFSIEGGTTNSRTSWGAWVEVSPSLPHGYAWAGLSLVRADAFSVVSNNTIAVQLGTGAPGSESTIMELANTHTNSNGAVSFVPPVPVGGLRRGQRLCVRVSGHNDPETRIVNPIIHLGR